MKKIISASIALALIFQLASVLVTTASADTSVSCTVTAASANATENVSVAASASSFDVSYTGNNIYTTNDVTFTSTSEVGSGLVFDHWEDGYGNEISQSSVYTVPLSASVDYKAYYSSYTPGTSSMLSTSDYDYSTEYGLSADSPVKLTTASVDVSVSVTVPRKYDVVEAGAVFYEGAYVDNFGIFNDDVVKVSTASITKTVEESWFISYVSGDYTVSYTPENQLGVLSRAYVIYTDGSSNLYIDYTEPQYTRPDTELYNNVKDYDVVFNWEMLSTFTGYGSSTVHSTELHQEDINEVCESKADLITVTPQMYRMNLYPTDVEGEGFAEKEEYLENNPDYEMNYYLMSASAVGGKTWYDSARDYIYIQGKDPTLDVIQAVKNNGADCFINYRMNDHHNTQTDKETPDNDRTGYPTHSAFWLENEDEYGIGFGTNRVLNYMEPHIRDHYYRILEELATKYIDYIDGIELDFDRYFEYFSFAEVSQGSAILTDFVANVRDMLNRVGAENGKYLQLSVRVPGQTAKCEHYGIDALTWDARGYVDIIALSNHYFNTMDIDIEAFTANGDENSRAHARIDGEIHYISHQESTNYTAANGAVSSSSYRRYLTKEGYYATAANYLARGSDGVHLFNVLYSAQREQIYKDLAVLTDEEALAQADKCYIMQRSGRNSLYDGSGSLNSYIGFRRTADTGTYNLYVPDDMSLFTDAVLKLEYTTNIVDDNGNSVRPNITVTWGSDSIASTTLKEVNIGSTELFPALADNQSYTTWDECMFFKVPMELMTSTDGVYTFTVTLEDAHTINSETDTLYVESAEFGLYDNSDNDDNELSDLNPGFSEGVNNITVTDTAATVGAVEAADSQDGDGYVLSASNRTDETVGGRFENVSFIPGNLYVVSAFAKLADDGEATAVMNVDRDGAVSSGSEITVSDDGWTRVFLWYDLTGETGEAFEGDIYVTTPASTCSIYLDNFELFKAEPYTPVDGNIYEQLNPSFEAGSVSSWLTYKATVSASQADPFPHTGKWYGVATERNQDESASTATGLQLAYIDVLPDTYYYVSGYGRTNSSTSVDASINMQYQLVKSGETTVSSTGGDLVIRNSAELDNVRWQRIDGVFKTISDEALEADYSGYSIQGKVYISADKEYDLFYDDFAVVPICIDEAYKNVTPKDGIVALELTVPVEFEVSTETLTTNVGTLKSISRNGTKCVVTLEGIDEAAEGTLTLAMNRAILNAPDASLAFKVSDPNLIADRNPGFAEGVSEISVVDIEAEVEAVEADFSNDGDGYVLSVTGRTDEIAGGKFENIQLEAGKLYVVSAFAMLQSDETATAQMVVATEAEALEGNDITVSSEAWTRVFTYLDLTQSEEDGIYDIYVTTPSDTSDIYLDSFRVFEVEPYIPVEGNIYKNYNPSFELGKTTSWVVNKANGEVIQADPFPHSGMWCGYSYSRSSSSTSTANGFQTNYVAVEPDTYYYVSGWARIGSSEGVSSYLPMQFQLAKSGASSVSNAGGSQISHIGATLDNTMWKKMHGLYKTVTQEYLDENYSGYTIKAKIYPSVAATEDVYADDFAAVPLCINSDSRIVNATNGKAVVNLTVPVEFETSSSTLTTDIGEIVSIERNGINCIVTIEGLGNGVDGTLTLITSGVLKNSEPAVMSFKVSGTSVAIEKSESGESLSCSFRNYTASSADVRLAIVAYDNNRVVDFTFADAITVGAYTTGEAVTLPLYTNGDRVEILALHPDSIVPYIIPFDCTGMR